MIVKIKTLDHFDRQLEFPCYQTPHAAGADIRACLGRWEKIIIRPAQRVLIPPDWPLKYPEDMKSKFALVLDSLIKQVL